MMDGALFYNRWYSREPLAETVVEGLLGVFIAGLGLGF